MASSSPETSKLETAKSLLTTAASIAATVVLARSVVNDLLPYELQNMLSFGIGNLLSRYSSQRTIVIEPYNGLEANQVYEAVEIYVGQKVSPATRRLRVSKLETEESISVAVERDETVTDVFSGIDMEWTLVCKQIEPRRRDESGSETRSFELVFHKKHLKLVLSSYLPHIIAQSKILKQEKKTLKIFTCDPEQIMYNISDAWLSTNLDHPATFETLAMDAEIRSFVLEDLDRFVRRRDYYRKVGKAWKRGYLLYGPPGTGKSSLIAAMANHLRFDIYDLELTALRSNSDLKKLLIAISNRSILVIEDIDCSVNFDDRNKAPDPENPTYNQPQITLSGLLNFIDGLWSSCGDERIIIFTTNHREKLDPALLRPGRMDVHIHMSYCTPCGFRTLASNYLDLKDHPLFPEVDCGLRSSEATPAEVAEELIKSNDPDLALRGLIKSLDAKKKKKEKDDEEAEKKKAGQEEKDKNITVVADVDQTVPQSIEAN